MHIRGSTEPKQWQYVLIDQNLVNQETRPMSAAHVASTNWLFGPPFLSQLSPRHDNEAESIELVQPDADKDIWAQVTCLVRK